MANQELIMHGKPVQLKQKHLPNKGLRIHSYRWPHILSRH